MGGFINGFTHKQLVRVIDTDRKEYGWEGVITDFYDGGVEVAFPWHHEKVWHSYDFHNHVTGFRSHLRSHVFYTAMFARDSLCHAYWHHLG